MSGDSDLVGAECPKGRLYPKGHRFPGERVVGTATADGGRPYQLVALEGGRMGVRSPQTDRTFVLDWGGLVDLAVESGLDRPAEPSMLERLHADDPRPVAAVATEGGDKPAPPRYTRAERDKIREDVMEEFADGMPATLGRVPLATLATLRDVQRQLARARDERGWKPSALALQAGVTLSEAQLEGPPRPELLAEYARMAAALGMSLTLGLFPVDPPADDAPPPAGGSREAVSAADGGVK